MTRALRIRARTPRLIEIAEFLAGQVVPEHAEWMDDVLIMAQMSSLFSDYRDAAA